MNITHQVKPFENFDKHKISGVLEIGNSLSEARVIINVKAERKSECIELFIKEIDNTIKALKDSKNHLSVL